MNRILPGVFAAAFLLTLAGSISHVAWFFGALEADRSTPLGLLIALGLDSVIGAVTLAQVEYRRRGEAIPRSMIVLLVGLVAVSAAANYLHADAYNSLSGQDWRRVATNLLGALPLPFSQLLYVEVAVAAHRPAAQASVAAPVAIALPLASPRKPVLTIAPAGKIGKATFADVETSPISLARVALPLASGNVAGLTVAEYAATIGKNYNAAYKQLAKMVANGKASKSGDRYIIG